MILENVNTQRFTLNGIEYFKNYLSKIVGNKLVIYNAYNICDVLVEYTDFSNITLDGIVHTSVASLQSALLPVIYTRDSLGGAVTSLIDFNRFTFENGFTFNSQNLTINAGWTWLIQGINYTNSSSVLINIPLATIGKRRLDIVYADASNNFHLLQGLEVVSNPIAPSLPVNTLLTTTLLTTDSITSTIPSGGSGSRIQHIECVTGTQTYALSLNVLAKAVFLNGLALYQSNNDYTTTAGSLTILTTNFPALETGDKIIVFL